MIAATHPVFWSSFSPGFLIALTDDSVLSNTALQYFIRNAL